MMITYASSLSDDQLAAELARLARGEREATVALVVHLAEFDARGLYRGAGFRSLFEYCMTVLGLSEDAVFNRIETARAARRYPAIVDMLERGSLSVTTARMLARKLTPENHREVLGAAAGMNKKEVEKLLACRFPEKDVQSSVRKRPVPTPTVLSTADQRQPTGTSPFTDAGSPPVTAFAPRPVLRPLAVARYEVRFTASEAMRENIQLAQEMLSHVVPSGDLAQVFDRALMLLVEDLARKKFRATGRPGTSHGQAEDSRNIPADVQRIVWVRDRGCCAFVGADGRRCGSRHFVEFHHVVPYAAGGKPTVENIALRCHAHNGYEAELFFGPIREYAGGVLEAVARGRTAEPRRTAVMPGRSGTPIAVSARLDGRLTGA
jgi:hypothetical protein